MSVSLIEAPTSASQVLTILNPATEEVLADVECTSRAQFDEACARAQRAFARWRRDEARRREALRRCAAVLRKRANSFELATLLTQEQGKPKREALNEVYAAAHWFASMAAIEIPVESCSTDNGSAEIRHEPVGVVGAITSWNFPVFLAACKIASALLPGNTILLKPSPYTPLSTIKLAELLSSTVSGHDPPLPEGVFTVVNGDRHVGEWLLETPEVSHVSFTGSVGVGKQILRDSAELLKPTTLELGGNDSAIVLADADVEQIVEPLFWSAFTNAGQFCAGVKRLYVHQAIYNRVVGKFAALARGIVVGNGLHPKTQMGPLANRSQFVRINELVESTLCEGATVVAGGEPLSGPGYFYPPTIVTDAVEGMQIVDDEQFGPVLPIMPFSNVEDVIERVNATEFGLGGSVWTQDRQRASEIAARLECGAVWMNRHGVLDPRVPFGGHKQSGLGYENGWAGVSEFTRIKALYWPP